ncbi:Chromo domain-containing protein [Caenorhabditis elegans]|uniref:Chromo domain-containing protein n=1 Tax=Caenorhabditis elegans TaxID=6239 RepID=Q18313_CAEEL|nr:Chromo domain-containing protein [Caenorhabditis elegans]CCD66109.2 Chromo domain-containing protein [Caenorhabditis elegans]|eukprot:NP_495224.2 Heritable Enhancer of RnaI (RNAi) [Caenorhabditis elegans]
MTQDSDSEYEIERIIDHVSFLEAYESFYGQNVKRFAAIFSEERFKRTKKPQLISNYFFLVKWLGYGNKEMTWEPESNIPDSVYLYEYKKLNNMVMNRMNLKVSLTFTSRRKGYTPPVILEELQERKPKPQFLNMSNMAITLNDNLNNGKFGIVPVPKYKKKFGQNVNYLKFGNEVYKMKNVSFKDSTNNDIDNRVQQHHHEDRSFLQSMIKHNNIVRMRDLFVSYNKLDETVNITSIYDWCHQNLRQQLNNEKVSWKKVCRDILNALSFIHPYGIHQGVSLDHIYYHKGGTYKLSHFNNFFFGKRIPAEKVKSDRVELAPRLYNLKFKLGRNSDIYALAIVLLQCHNKKFSFRVNPSSVMEIEEDIAKGMSAFENKDDRHFLKSLLRARLHVYHGSGHYRFTSSSLLHHPVLQEPTARSVECFYFHSMLASPMKEIIHYHANDKISDVLQRFISLYHTSQEAEDKKYIMMFTKDTSSCDSVVLLNSLENFERVVDIDLTIMKNTLLIAPIILPSPENENCQKFLIIYEQELGGCPIVIETPEVNAAKFAKQLKEYSVSHEYRNRRLGLFPKLPGGDQQENGGLPEFSHHVWQMQLESNDDTVIKNRFDIASEIEMPLSGEMLEWDDVAGIANYGEILRNNSDNTTSRRKRETCSSDELDEAHAKREKVD